MMQSNQNPLHIKQTSSYKVFLICAVSLAVILSFGCKLLVRSNMHWQFQPLFDYFDVLPDTFAASHFGLIGKDWDAFDQQIRHLQQNAYVKVLFLARHGEGFHNVAETKYTTTWWDCKWAMLKTDGELVWGPDPLLSPLGEKQAQAANVGWRRELTANKAPMPDLFYVSPLSRAASTAQITWEGLSTGPFIFKEQWRESIGLHTCDQRRTKSYLRSAYPSSFEFEEGFAEEDELYTVDTQETHSQEDYRLHMALEALFNDESKATYVAISAHSGTINSLLRTVGHLPVRLGTGGMLPIVLKATKTTQAKPLPDPKRWTAPSCPV